MSLSRLGIPKLWREDPEILWPSLRYFVAPPTMWLAPSAGYGADRVPAGGGVIACNHLSAIDPPLVGAHCPRAIHWMAKAELLALPLVGEILQWTGAFPVRRGQGDRDALRRARALARDGHMVGMFVKGTRQRLGHPGKVLPGAMTIALREDVPVVPCGVYSFGWSLRNRMRCAVIWGEPVDLAGLAASASGYREAAVRVGEEILRLWRLAGEAVADDYPVLLSDGARRTSQGYAPFARNSRTPRLPASVKKALA